MSCGLDARTSLLQPPRTHIHIYQHRHTCFSMAGRATLPGLKAIRHIVAVSSCKGGVGKSLVAVNTACALQAQGHRVGIFDADLYGPSLPTMMRLPPEEAQLRPDTEGMAIPPNYKGIKTMSFGYMPQSGQNGSSAAVMRGPRASAVMQQLLGSTAWGDLDFLIVDMPPGTGDIPLTLCQTLSFSSAIVVTTPAKLSIVDVEKGMDMFEDLKVPVSAIVENMSHFDGNDGERYYPFGRGHVKRLMETRHLSADSVYTLPIDEVLCVSADAGVPILLGSNMEHMSLAQPFMDLALHVTKQIEEAEQNNQEAAMRPTVFFDEKRKGIVLRFLAGEFEGREYVVHPASLRRDSRDAKTIHEMTGERLVDPKTISDDVVPVRITPQGNYAVAIGWSDGHDDAIYTFEQMIALAPDPIGKEHNKVTERRLKR
jgi:Mrp family chromosome partitioning ATPase/DUF971 family protein